MSQNKCLKTNVSKQMSQNKCLKTNVSKQMSQNKCLLLLLAGKSRSHPAKTGKECRSCEKKSSEGQAFECTQQHPVINHALLATGYQNAKRAQR
jgi:hypothetical protein